MSPKAFRSFRLSEQALEDLSVCLELSKLRMLGYGYQPPSQAEVLAQALARQRKYLEGLKLGEGGGSAKKKK